MPTQQYRKSDPQSIREMFSSIATRYDTGNAALSLQLFRSWNRRLIQQVLLTPEPVDTVLDLCCGTGEITFTYLRALHKLSNGCPKVNITLVDFAEGMLHEAERKAAQEPFPQASLVFRVGDAQAIPLPDCSVDAVVIAYGIRNVANPQKCIEEALRVLRLGGRLGILELTRPQNPLMRFGHTVYLRTVVPLLGKWITSNPHAYHYLCQSIESFVPAERLHQLMQQVGFVECTCQSLTGGIATLLFGRRR